jgi:hypothetical protein
LDPAIGFGRGGFQAEQVHVWARVQASQHPVHVDGVSGAVLVEPLGDDDLEDVAVDDVLLGRVHGGQEIVPFGAVHRGGLRGQVDLGHEGLRRLGEPGLQRVQTGLRGRPERIPGFDAVIEHVHDQLHCPQLVVDHHEVGDEAERLPWHVVVGRRPVGQPFDLADRFPTDEADEPTGQRRVLGEARRLPAFVEVAEGVQRWQVDDPAEGAFGGHAVVEPGGVVSGLGEHAEGGHPDEGEPGPDAALLGGFEQEAAGRSAGELPVDAHGGFPVREEFTDHRDDPVSGEEVAELACRGGAGAHGVASPDGSTSPVTSMPRPSKQVWVPVWQAAPICSTCTTRVSASQSSAAERTNCA